MSFPHSLSSPLHPLPPRATASVDHIVAVRMEKHSFDYLLGWHPIADARSIDLSYLDEQNNLSPTVRLLAGILKLLGKERAELMSIFGGVMAVLPSWCATLE